MSNTVDNRVVEMSFDNKRFEQNVSTSMSTIDKLNNKLQMISGTKGLENIGNAAKKVDMTGLSNSVETVQTKFSALQVMGVTALANLTNSAVNAGKRIVSALTIDPIKTGLSEYETQMNAVQTILANTQSKGTTLKDVNGALDELNTYADKTIYNFTEMTRNIGTFTAAGVDLDTSVKSIKGIANLAAVSGSSSQQASTAMYQLSQALAAGKVSLMDWNSVVNAGMGGQVFQDALKRTAENMGTDVDALIKKYGSFRESLSKGEWLTADVLNKTLEQFTMAAEEGSKEWDKYKKSLMSEGYTEKQAVEILKMANTATDAATKVKTATQLWDTLKETAQSGWTQTWEIIFGDFEEAKGMFSDMYNTLSPLIEAMSKSRNDLLQGWKDDGGRTDLIKSLYNAFEGVLSISKTVKDAFRDLFPPITSDRLVSITKGILNLTEKFKEITTSGSEFSNNLKRTFKGVFAIFSIGAQVVKGLFSGIGELLKRLAPTGSSLLGFTGSIGDALVKFDAFLKKGNVFTQFFKGVATVVGTVVEWIRKFVVKIGDVTKLISSSFMEGFNKFADNAERRLHPMTMIAEGLKSVLSFIGKAIGKIAPIFVSLARKVGELFRAISDGIADAINNADYNVLFDIFNSGVIASIVLGIRSIFKGFGDMASDIGDFWDGLKESLSDIKDAVLDTFGAIQNNLKAGMLKKIASAIATLAVSLWLISTIDSEKLAASLGSVAILFGELLGSMAIFMKMTEGMSKANITSVIKVTTAMKGLATALLILSAAMKIMSTMSWQEMGVALISMATGIGVMIGALWLMPSDKKLNQSVKAIKKLSSSLIIFAVALKIMSTMSWQEMGVALISMTTGLGVLVGALHLLPNEAKLRSSTKAIKKLASSLLVLSIALKIMSTMSFKEMTVALISMVVGISAMVAAVKLLPKDAGIKALGLTSLATAMVVLGAALKIMGSMSIKEMGVALVSLAGSLTAITLALKLMPKNVLGIGVGLMVVTTSLVILAKALTTMGGMSTVDLAKSLIALAISLGVLVAAMHLMKSAVPGAAAMLIMAAALAIFTPQLKSLGSMSIGGLVVALVALAGSFAVLGLAAYFLAPLVPVMLALAGALAVLGAGVALFGIGVTLLSVGLSTLAVGASAIAGAIVAILSAVISMIPFLFEQLAAAIVAFCKVIVDGIPAIGEAIYAIVQTIIQVLVKCVPDIVEGLFVLITEVLAKLVEFVPKIVELVYKFLIAIVDELANQIPKLIKSFVNLIMSIFQGIVDALQTVDVNVLKDGIMAVGVVAGLMVALAAVAALTLPAMAGLVGVGLVMAELAFVLAAIGKLAEIPGLTELVNGSSPLLLGIGKAIGSFVGGIVGGIAQGATSTLPKVATNLATFMQNVKPFIDGAKSFDASAMDGVKALAGAIIALTAANVLEGITSWITGGSSVSKFANELVPLGKGLKSFSDEVSGISPEAITSAASAAKVLAEMTRIIPNEGGVAAWFAGENSIAKFGADIVELGKGLKSFSDSVVGVNPEAITATATAAKSLAEMCSIIPNEGGVVGWFAGENSISKFGTDIITLGVGLKGFSMAATGIDPETIIGASRAAKALAEMTATIPNEGGVAAWFAGENSIAKFSTDIITLGLGLKGFSDAVVGMDCASVTAAVTTARALAEITAIIPNSGGVVSWFTGDNSLSKFGTEIVGLGKGLKGFATEVEGINPMAIIFAANAAKSLAQMTSYIPNEGGIKAWFTGETSISRFAGELINLGKGLKGFATEVIDINPGSIIMAAMAAKTLAQMTSYIPNEGGIKTWFTGESSISKFGGELKALGTGLKGFSTEVTDIVPENVIAAANACKALAQMTSYIPTEGGMKSWFAGEMNMSNFADKLPGLGKGLKGFSDEVTDINPENVIAAANAAKSLAQMTSYIPTEGGMKAWFGGETNVADFADKLPNLGEGLKGFSDELDGISTDNITAGASAAKDLAKMTEATPKDTSKLISFGDNLVTFGGKLSSYFTSVAGIDLKSVTASSQAIQAVKDSISGFNASDFTSASKAIDELVNSVKSMSKINSKTTKGFSEAFAKIAETSISDILKEFKDAGPKMSDAGEELIKKFIKGVEGLSKNAKNAFKKIISSCVDAVNNVKSDFKNAGKNLVTGFANGITLYVYTAKKAARAMAAAAAEAAKEELDEHSPSKVGEEIGDFFGLGFVNAIYNFTDTAYKAGSSMAKSAKNGLSESIGRIADLVDGNIDTQPTIRPVMDLSSVKTGVDAISSMMGAGTSIGVLANVGSINSMMNRRSQNGTNADVVSEIKRLGAKLDKRTGDTYQINGVTYDDGSNINDAVKTIVRAARIERRV